MLVLSSSFWLLFRLQDLWSFIHTKSDTDRKTKKGSISHKFSASMAALFGQRQSRVSAIWHRHDINVPLCWFCKTVTAQCQIWCKCTFTPSSSPPFSFLALPSFFSLPPLRRHLFTPNCVRRIKQGLGCVFFLCVCDSQPRKATGNGGTRMAVLVGGWGEKDWGEEGGGVSGSQAVRECNLFVSPLLKKIPLRQSTQIFSLTVGVETFCCLSVCQCVVILRRVPRGSLFEFGQLQSCC